MKYKWFKKFVAWWAYQRWDLKKAVAFHATSEEEANDIRRMGFSQPVFVVSNGVELPEKTGDEQRVGRETNIKGHVESNGNHTGFPLLNGEKKHFALFLSRLHPGKGLLDLAVAWAKVKAMRCPNFPAEELESESNSQRSFNPLTTSHWRMRVVGPDSYGHKAEVIAKLKELGIENEWEFVDEVSDDDKWKEYRNADLFIHPSHSENFGISIAEALYASIPVITTKGAPWQELLGCSRDRVQSTERETDAMNLQPFLGAGAVRTLISQSGVTANGRCGWWIDIGAEPLATVLQEAMGLSDQERWEMGQNGKILVERKYTWPVIARQMKTAYEWLLKGGNPPECVRLS
jgi:glycosyltransferase involved in cell wall biosynthesis